MIDRVVILLHRFGGRLRALFWAAAAFAFVMASLPKPPQLPGDPGDKVQHIIAFAVLALLARLGWLNVSGRRLLAGLSAFGALIELVQAIPALGRHADWIDWAADTVAAGLVLGLAALVRKMVPAAGIEPATP
jgi:VanZ family protein